MTKHNRRLSRHNHRLLRRLIFMAVVAVVAFFTVTLYRFATSATSAPKMVGNSEIRTETGITSRDSLAKPVEKTYPLPSGDEAIMEKTLKSNKIYPEQQEQASSSDFNSDKQEELFSASTPEAIPPSSNAKLDKLQEISITSQPQEIGESANLNSNKSQEIPTNSKPEEITATSDQVTNPASDPIIPNQPGVSPSSTQPLSKESSSGEIRDITYVTPAKFQAKLVHKLNLPQEEKLIALTFDDGPWPRTTEQILDILKQNDVIATFFWVGENLKNYPKIAQKVAADGHAIGNHTWHHWYRKMNRDTVVKEIDNTTELIYKTTGIKTSLFRPPGAVLDSGVVDYAKQKKYSIIMWSNDSIDYRPYAAKQLVNNVMKKAKPGAIVLMHDGGGNRAQTVKALPEIIQQLQQLGYRFVTIPQLLQMDYPFE